MMCRIPGHLVACAIFCAFILPAAAQQTPFEKPFGGDGTVPPAGTSAASANFDATYYHLTLDVRLSPQYLYGHTRIEGRAVNAPLSMLTLDFAANMIVDSVRSATGTPLAFTHDGDALAVDLADTVPVGAAVAIDVYYQGMPATEGIFYTFVFGERSNGDPFVWTLSEPYGARAWWPSKDHPSDKADSVRVTVTVPEPLRVGSNGLLVSEQHQNGRATYDWLSHYPIATYLVSFAAGVYDVHDQTYVRPDSLAAELGPLSMPLLHYEYRGTTEFDGTADFNGWRRVVDVLPVFEYWFGPYPFSEEKYGHAQFTYGGAMEHQTMTSMGSNYIGTVAHELTHQWFGDLITTRTWPHLWLNEGFATYGELLYYEARPRLYADAFNTVFDIYYTGARGAVGTLVVQDTTAVSNLFASSRVYRKGGMVLHMLRHLVGDDVFRQILHAYAADPALRYGTATTADFQRVVEEVSGRNFDTFFRQWVTEGTGYPTYELRWGYVPSGAGYEVTATIEQTQPEAQSNVEAFEMPITLAVQTAGGEQRVQVMDDRRTQTFTFDVAAEPQGIVLDPDRAVLRAENVTVIATEPPAPLPSITRITSVAPNPAVSTSLILYETPQSGPVRLGLYDVLGRRVRVLFEGALPAGAHELRIDTSVLPSGLYVVRLEGADGVASFPVTVVR